jgi:hypothetical protein
MSAIAEINTASGTDAQVLPSFPFYISISVSSGTSDDETIFKGLAASWRQATGHLSVLSKRYEHPTYNAIVDMGPSIVPFILQELQRSPDRWFNALERLTGANPAKDATTFQDAVRLWLKWGRDNKYIP